MPLKTIALVDSLWGGHHPTYLKLFTQTLLELGHEVITLSPEPAEMNRWINSRCISLASRFYSFELKEPDPAKLTHDLVHARVMSLLRWQRAARSIEEISCELGTVPDLTFFTWLDDYLGLIPSISNRLFPYPWSGLYFQPLHQRIPPKLPWIRRGFLNPLSVLKSKNCPGLAILDEGVAKVLQHKLNKPVLTFPDFTDEASPDTGFQTVQEIVAKAAGRKIIGLLGSLDKRKGILTLLDIAQQIKTPWFFVFAGELAERSFTDSEREWIHKIVNSNPENCFFHLTRIPTEAQFNAVVQICDLLYAAYENFPTSSNLLIKAAVFEKPIIVSENYCMGERVKKFNLGFTVKERDVAQCIWILDQFPQGFLNTSSSFEPDFQGYRKQHSVEQLKHALAKLLELV